MTKIDRLNQERVVMVLGLCIIPLLSIVSPWVGILLMLASVLYYGVKCDYRTLLLFICLILVQEITLVIGANRFSKSTTTIYSLLKEVMFYGCVLLYVLKKKRIMRDVLLCTVFGISIIVAFYLSEASLYARILGFRQIMLPFVCYFFGRVLDISDNNLKKISKFIVVSAIAIGGLGLIERFVIGDRLWNALPLWQYEVNKGTTFRFRNDLPENFTTYDYVAITGTITRRLVSTFVNPLVTAHFLFLSFIVADTFNVKNKNLIKVFLFLCSIFTLSKGIFLAYLFYFAFHAIRRVDYRSMRWVTRVGAIILGVVFMGLYQLVVRYMPTSSTAIHMNGFMRAFENISLFGNGLGTAGVMTGILTGASGKLLTSESYIGTLSVQLGYLGIVIFIIFWMLAIYRLLDRGKKGKSKLYFNSAILLIAVLAESLFSESSIAIVGTGMYFVMAGIAIKRSMVRRMYE